MPDPHTNLAEVKDRAITIGAGVGNAVAIAVGTTSDPDHALSVFESIVDRVVEISIDQQVKWAVKAAFPGSVVESHAGAPAGVQPHTAPAPVGAYAGEPAPPPHPATTYTPVLSQPVPAAQPASVPAGYQQQQPAPAAVPGVTDGDPQVAGWWEAFFQNPDLFWDNRGPNKKFANSPDFNAKEDSGLFVPGKFSQKTGKPYTAGLYLTSDKNPSWVEGRLRQTGYIQ